MRTETMDSVPISASVPDWSREQVHGFWDPSRRLVRSVRKYQFWAGRGGPVAAVMRRAHVLAHRFWSIVCAAEIPLNGRIGGGLLLPHPVGIVVHPDTVIGPNCLIFQGVTLGGGGPRPGVPVVGGHVDIGAGAKLLGGVKVGDHARIGANAVVLCDVPAGATAVGVPARIIGGSSGDTR